MRVLLVSMLVWAACGGGDGLLHDDDAGAGDGATVQTDLAPGEDGGEPAPFAVEVSTQALAIAAGETQLLEVTLTRDAGFTDLVAIALEGLPSGVSSVPSTAQTLAGAATKATFAITAAVTAPSSGPHALTVRATSGEESASFR
jgi:hypothetical protein